MRPEIRYSPNATIEFFDDHVTKTLKKRASREKQARFEKECEIQRTLTLEGVGNVAEVLEVAMDEDPPWYKMKRYDGDSNTVLDRTRLDVPFVADLLLPIVDTLKRLHERDAPVIHRDIKPENLLCENTAEGLRLVLADFGCVFFQTDEDDRITGDFRVVGAMAFRAPEYQHGRVDQVTEMGDVFSVGKLLWYYVNGVKNEVFPFTLWFQEEYNLQVRYPDTVGIAKLNSIIASCTHHDPGRRTSYAELLAALASLIESATNSPEDQRKLQAQDYQDRLYHETQEASAMARTLLGVFVDDARCALQKVDEQFGTIPLIAEMQRNFRLISGEQETLRSVVSRDLDYPLWSDYTKNISIASFFVPARHWKMYSLPEQVHPFIRLQIAVQHPSAGELAKTLYWFYGNNNTLQQWSGAGEIVTHSPKLLSQLFVSCLAHCFS